MTSCPFLFSREFPRLPTLIYTYQFARGCLVLPERPGISGAMP